MTLCCYRASFLPYPRRLVAGENKRPFSWQRPLAVCVVFPSGNSSVPCEEQVFSLGCRSLPPSCSFSAARKMFAGYERKLSGRLLCGMLAACVRWGMMQTSQTIGSLHKSMIEKLQQVRAEIDEIDQRHQNQNKPFRSFSIKCVARFC